VTGNLLAYNQVEVPSFMYGTAWKKESTTHLVELAVSAGFTAIDTANQIIHYDEGLVGKARLELERTGIRRETLFLQTKFTPTGGQDHRTPYDASASITTQVRQSFESSLEHLHTDYVDSYVLHGPYSRVGLGEADWEVWSAIEEIYESSRAKMIGISNVNPAQLDLLCERASIKPMVVQNRCFAVLGWDQEVREICRANEIIYQGFSLLTANRGVLDDPEVQKIASRLAASPAQVVFRFAMEVGMLPLTGTTNELHMKEDLKAKDLELTSDEVQRILELGSS